VGLDPEPAPAASGRPEPAHSEIAPPPALAGARPAPGTRRWWPPSAARTRWIAVWLLLASVDLAVWALSRRLLAGALSATAEDLLGLLLIPPLQTAALAGLLAMRRQR
jgi:hypothetical protein